MTRLKNGHCNKTKMRKGWIGQSMAQHASHDTKAIPWASCRFGGGDVCLGERLRGSGRAAGGGGKSAGCGRWAGCPRARGVHTAYSVFGGGAGAGCRFVVSASGFHPGARREGGRGG